MKSVLALIAGLVVMVVSIALIQALGHSIYPAPADLDTASADAMATYVATLPLPALLFPLFAYIVGTFAGTITACFIGPLKPVIYAGIIGTFVLAGTIANLILIPHPLWFSIFAVIGIGMSAWLAVIVAENLRTAD